jgi:hypothetical protein
MHGDSNSNKWLEQRSQTAKHVAILHVVYINTGRTTLRYIYYSVYYFSYILSTHWIYERQLFLNSTSWSAIYDNQMLMSYGLSIQSFEDAHTTVYGVMNQTTIILGMRYGFTALEVRRVRLIHRSTGTPRLILWIPGRTSKQEMTWNIHPLAGRWDIQISGLSVAPVTGLATINNRCAYFELKFYSSSKWNFKVVRHEILQ